MSYFEVDHLTHLYGETTAIQEVSFTIAAGERLCLLGPSGCGKTTTLQAIAGFIKPSMGRILIGGSDIITLPPEERNIGIMFQNYALFPHMNVFDNVAFGLKMRKTPRDELESRVNEALKVVRLEQKASRLPSQLSGGEQQRVAFARAVVIRPRLLLLDEPFSNLDARLRLTMRNELLELLEGLEIATLMVTHDQEEAMSIGDRIVVMHGGRIRQIGTPQTLYNAPNSRFVGEFLGDSNLLPVRSVSSEGRVARAIVEGLGEVRALPVEAATSVHHLLVRPERIRLSSASGASTEQLPLAGGDQPNCFEGIVEHVTFLGPRIEVRVRVRNHVVQVFSDELDPVIQAGSRVLVTWPLQASILIGDADD
ncbi:ABC transporter ATP-binding protein [Rhizobium sp. SAFR-030]|uniref:ABC transporter ATP-binding protein n=1 Tax=Rhizobium sp. SAFR-030 TaxID=3387277 RepID=UPI003F7F65EF